MSITLPSRYEDLNPAYRGRLRANPEFIGLVQAAFRSMEVSGGIRFLPLFGLSGSGKSSAALELQTHLPELQVLSLSRAAIESSEQLYLEINGAKSNNHKGIVAIIDQYEEVAIQRSAIPTAFVEALAVADRGIFQKKRVLFIWLTTSKNFQAQLSAATSRNTRILLRPEFEISGPARELWPDIIEETFQVHNDGKDLADFEIIRNDLTDVTSPEHSTLGSALEQIGQHLSNYNPDLQDLSQFRIVILWPVTDGIRINTVRQFTDPRQGYKVDWPAWYRQLNADDRAQLPLDVYNKTRLYFDLRLVPVAAADIETLCRDLEKSEIELSKTSLKRFSETHFFSIIKGSWNPDRYAPLRERESSRAEQARTWYSGVTTKPTQVGRRLALVLRSLGLDAEYEQQIESRHSKVKADILVKILKQIKIIR